MYLEWLRTYQFRNLADQEHSFSPRINYVVGKNGQGKTSLLEAVSLLALSKSFRTSRQSEMLRWQEEEGSVLGRVVSEPHASQNLAHGGKQDILSPSNSTEIGVLFKNRSKQLLIHGEKVKRTIDFVGQFSCVSFTPHDLNIVRGPTSERRRFFNRYMSLLDPKIYQDLVRLEKIVLSKNRLLKNHTCSYEEIEPWNELLAEVYIKLSFARKQFIAALVAKVNSIAPLFASADGEITVQLHSSIDRELNKIEASNPVALSDVKELLKTSFYRERSAGRSLYGPQRDEFEFLFSNRNLKAFGSQGQVRSVLLATLMAIVEMIEEKSLDTPVILLDDVESELDDQRFRDFSAFLIGKKAQVFISGTNHSIFKLFPSDLEMAVFEIDAGQIKI